MDEADEMQDLFLEDWDGIFDDDGPALSLGDNGLDFDINATTESSNGESTDTDANNNSSSSRPASSKPEPVRRRRIGREIEQGGRGVPPPTWHSEAADRPHRQAMIAEMYVT